MVALNIYTLALCVTSAAAGLTPLARRDDFHGFPVGDVCQWTGNGPVGVARLQELLLRPPQEPDLVDHRHAEDEGEDADDRDRVDVARPAAQERVVTRVQQGEDPEGRRLSTAIDHPHREPPRQLLSRLPLSPGYHRGR